VARTKVALPLCCFAPPPMTASIDRCSQPLILCSRKPFSTHFPREYTCLASPIEQSICDALHSNISDQSWQRTVLNTRPYSVSWSAVGSEAERSVCLGTWRRLPYSGRKPVCFTSSQVRWSKQFSEVSTTRIFPTPPIPTAATTLEAKPYCSIHAVQ